MFIQTIIKVILYCALDLKTSTIIIIKILLNVKI
jgi:hypothetical protein